MHIYCKKPRNDKNAGQAEWLGEHNKIKDHFYCMEPDIILSNESESKFDRAIVFRKY